MFAETHGVDAREAARGAAPGPAREEIAGIARGAGRSTRSSCARSTRAPRSSPARADRVLRGRRAAACWRRTGTGIRTCAPRPSIWIVEHPRRLVRDADRGRHAGQDRAQRRGPRRLPEPARARPPTAACDGTPIHVLLRQVLRDLPHRRRGDRAAHRARRSAPPRAVTVATPGDVATSSSHPAARTSSAAASARTRTTSSSRRAPGRDTMPDESPSTIPRLEVVRGQPLLDALRSHDGHPKGVCRHVDPAEPWVDQTVTVASVVMNLAALRLARRRRAALHARARADRAARPAA